MAADCCDDLVGGMVYLTVGDKRYEGSGEATLRNLSGVERTATASSGGRMVLTEVARLPEIEMSFINHCDAEPRDLYDLRCKVDVTFVEDSRGFRHYFSQASISGTYEYNTATGVVSGMRIVCDPRNYSRSRA